MIKNIAKFITETILETISPRHCEVCKKYIGTIPRRFEFICPRCTDSMPLAPEPNVIMNTFNSKFNPDDVGISNAYSLFSVIEDFRYLSIIYALKYSFFTRVGLEFGYELGNIINKYRDIDYDLIIPVPIHKARRRERGFNQSDIIANSVSKQINSEINNSLLLRKKYTQTQTVLTSSERKENVANVFTVQNNELVKNKIILIIDDVLTTGSTINACAITLLESGAKRIDCATLAYA